LHIAIPTKYLRLLADQLSRRWRQQMLQRILRWLTMTLLAVSFSGNNSSASPLEDSLAASAERDACMKKFVSLRDEALARFKLFRAASERHASPDEACKLITNYGQFRIKTIEYIEANETKCGSSPMVDRLKASLKDTEATQKKVCAEPAYPVGDFDIGAPPLVR
jgi:hypothetical protein